MVLDLHVGEKTTLRLPGLGSAGYAWEWEVTGDQRVVEISASSAEPPTTAAPGGPPPPNSSPDQVFTVIGRAVGQVRVRLVHRRPWERGNPPLEERILDIVVT